LAIRSAGPAVVAVRDLLSNLSFSAVSAGGDLEWKPACYVAFVLRAGDPDDVRMIDLGEAEPIDLLIADFQENMQSQLPRSVSAFHR
jgi:hypothetical protein